MSVVSIKTIPRWNTGRRATMSITFNEYISISDVKIFQRWNTGRRATNFSRQTSAHRWEDDLVWFDVQLFISSIISFLIYVNFSINICTLTKEILFPNCKSVAVSFTICKWCASAIWGALPDNTRAQHENCCVLYNSKCIMFILRTSR